ncbi:hypothetical protein KPL70_020662 [Citrus sinensis]|nr:hypothetical protein KPL70_020662 [Citrus sinensis]
MVECETSRIEERSTETISEDTSGGRQDLSNRYSAPVIGGQKIDVEKFDGKINFGIWRREVMDALIQIDLDVVLKNKRHLYDEEIWDRMNEKTCGQIRSCLTKEVKYLVKDEECVVTLWRTLEEKYLVKSPENRLHAMSQVYGFRMKLGVSMHDHVSRFEKLLADLKNLDKNIKDEVKAMILLHSLPKEYSHFVTTLIYGKSVIVFKDVCTALTSLEIRNNDKNSERASSEALVSRDWAIEKQKKHGGNNSRSKSRSRNIARDECAFCHEKGHWRKDCPKAQKRDGKKPAAANMARKDEDSDYSLSITPAAYVANLSEWILDTGATYHLCPIKEWFTDFRNLESGAVVMGNNQPCALEAKGYKVIIEDGTMKFTHGAMVILQGVRRHNLYYLKGGTTDEANVVEAHSDTTKLWHVRLGHAGEKSLQTLMRHGLLKSTKTKLNFCEHCVVGKKTRVKFGTANHDTREILEYVHSDNEGIKRHFTVRHTPQQNNVVEHMNRTLLEKVRCMLSNAGLDKKFWAEAVSYASHLVNRLPSAAIGGKTPMEMWFGKHAQDYDSLRIFGCPAYYNVNDGKLDPRARKTIFMGFKGGVKGFKLWNLEDKKFVENKTTKVLQRVEFDATPYVPVSSTLKNSSTMEVTPRVEEELLMTTSPTLSVKHYAAVKVISGIVKHISIRILLALVVEYELELAQLDVKTAFLHGDLEEEIYMIQPCGFKVAGKENHACRRLPDGAFIYLLLYVDDMLIASKNRDEIKRLKKQLASEFEMKDLGDAQRILVMEIRRDKKNESVWLTQKSYLKKVLERFGIDDKTKLICTPLAPHFKLSSSSCLRSQEKRDYMARVPYASVVGSLMYAMVCTRPDISQAVSMWMLGYYSRRIVVNNVLGIVILISLETLTSEDQQWASYSYWVEVRLAEGRFYNRQLLCPLRKPSIWQQLKL